MGKSSRPPPPPDPRVTAQAQGTENRTNAAFNNAMLHGNTSTPWGSQTYTPRVDPTTGATVYDQSIQLDPQQQALLDIYNANDLQFGQAQQRMLGGVTSSLEAPIDYSGAPALRDAPGVQGYRNTLNTSGLPELQTGGYQQGIDTSGLQGIQTGGYNRNAAQQDSLSVGGPQLQGTLDTQGLPQMYGADDLMAARQQAQDALYGRQAAFLDPQWQQRDTQFRTRMANQGVAEGSEAWNNAFDAEQRARAFDYGQARNSAIAGGGDEMTRLFGIARGNRGQAFGERQAAGDFQNNARQQALSEALALGGFGNNARLTNAQFGNAATQASNAEANAARGQGFGELMSMGQFGNAARAATNAESAAARGQMFDEAAMGGQFANQAADAINRANLAAAGFGNAARAQSLQELFAMRSQPLNEYSALRSGAQVAQPQFQNAQVDRTNPVDVAGITQQNYNDRLNIWNAQQQQRNALMSGLFGLGSSYLLRPR